MAEKNQPSGSKKGKATTESIDERLSRVPIPRSMVLAMTSQPPFNPASGGRFLFSAILKPPTASEGSGPGKAKGKSAKDDGGRDLKEKAPEEIGDQKKNEEEREKNTKAA